MVYYTSFQRGITWYHFQIPVSVALFEYLMYAWPYVLRHRWRCTALIEACPSRCTLSERLRKAFAVGFSRPHALMPSPCGREANEATAARARAQSLRPNDLRRNDIISQIAATSAWTLPAASREPDWLMVQCETVSVCAVAARG